MKIMLEAGLVRGTLEIIGTALDNVKLGGYKAIFDKARALVGDKPPREQIQIEVTKEEYAALMAIHMTASLALDNATKVMLTPFILQDDASDDIHIASNGERRAN